MDAALLDQIISVLKYERLVVDYTYVAAASILFYDYLLMISMEIKYIWWSKWTVTKVLYLLARYLPIVDTSIVLYLELTPEVPLNVCKTLYPLANWLVVMELVITEGILGLRTWAIWKRSRNIGIGLGAMMLANLVVQFYFVNRVNKSMTFAPALYPGYRGCFITGASRIIWVNYASLTVVEIVVLALVCISAFRSYRQGHSSELTNVVHKDGIMFYVYLLVLTIANVFIDLLAPEALLTMISPLEDCLYSVLTTRIIINIRDVTYSQHETVTITTDQRNLARPLEFRSNSSTNIELRQPSMNWKVDQDTEWA